MKPGSSPITLTLSASSISADVVADDLKFSFETQDFDRPEYDPGRLKEAMDRTTYAKAIITQNAVNAPVQIGIESCGFSTPLYLGPIDNYIDLIEKRFNITKYTITGAPSSPSAIVALKAIAIDHAKRLNKFDAYQAEVGKDISYQRLIELQSETFSYLTSTGLSFSAWSQSGSNCLITSFEEGSLHEQRVSGTVLSRNWSMTLEKREITSRRSLD